MILNYTKKNKKNQCPTAFYFQHFRRTLLRCYVRLMARAVRLSVVCLSSVKLLWTPAQRKRASMLYSANVFIFIFLWPPYSPALVNGGSRKFYTWWTLSVIEEVTSWIFFWSSLNYRVGQKVTKFRIFSDPARKLSALTPERGRIL